MGSGKIRSELGISAPRQHADGQLNRKITMASYRHHISGFFAKREQADGALLKLIERGLAEEQLHIFATKSSRSPPALNAESNGVLKDVLVDASIGTAVGTGIGALAEVGLVMANVSLFVASPLLAPLMLMGWGATVGGLIGATVGASDASVDRTKNDGWFSQLIGDAISSGHVVLVVETRTEQETAIAREIIEASIGYSKDVGAD